MIIEDVHDNHTFITFLGELRSELADPAAIGGWENATLHIFLKPYRLGRTIPLRSPATTLGNLRQHY
jgi:hypothetical protein